MGSFSAHHGEKTKGSSSWPRVQLDFDQPRPDESEPTTTDEFPKHYLSMLAAIKDIRDRSQDENRYVGDGQVQHLTDQAKAALAGGTAAEQ